MKKEQGNYLKDYLSSQERHYYPGSIHPLMKYSKKGKKAIIKNVLIMILTMSWVFLLFISITSWQTGDIENSLILLGGAIFAGVIFFLALINIIKISIKK